MLFETEQRSSRAPSLTAQNSLTAVLTLGKSHFVFETHAEQAIDTLRLFGLQMDVAVMESPFSVNPVFVDFDGNRVF